MADELPVDKPDLTPAELAKLRLPDPITPSEREVFVARIKELEAEVADLKGMLEKANKPKPEPKRKTVLDRFSPL
jgi:hypothetical protein